MQPPKIKIKAKYLIWRFIYSYHLRFGNDKNTCMICKREILCEWRQQVIWKGWRRSNRLHGATKKKMIFFKNEINCNIALSLKFPVLICLMCGKRLNCRVQRDLVTTCQEGFVMAVSLGHVPKHWSGFSIWTSIARTSSFRSYRRFFLLPPCLPFSSPSNQIMGPPALLKDLWVLNSVAWDSERTIRTERPPLVCEVSANFCGYRGHVVSVTDPNGRILSFLYRKT
jgi:hypothetical protein